MSSQFALNIPINTTSLGQVSTSIAREIYKRGLNPNIFPIGKVDLSSQPQDPEFFKWIEFNANNALKAHNRNTPVFKLWHLQGSLESYSNKQVLLSFYEVDKPTDVEINIAKNNEKLLLSSRYAISKFKDLGVDNVEFLPLGFDSEAFRVKDKKRSDTINFGLFGKLEPQRKRHLKSLSTWAKVYGNNPKYSLNCAIFNHFLDPKIQSQIINQALEGKSYWNINFLPYIPDNASFNDLLNSIDIVLAMSGGEGWGLPEFQAVALGKHCVGLNAHAYKDWMTEENSVLVKPSGKIPVYDNMFFKEGAPFNQGEIFDWAEDDLVSAMKQAEKKFESSALNLNGIKLQAEFSYTRMTNSIISIMGSL
jgi:hypothetical protein